MAGSAVHTISIIVDAHSNGVAPGLSAGLAALTNFETKAQSSLGRVKTAFGGLSTGAKAFAGVTVAVALLATGLNAVIGPAIQFESAFAGVRKTVDGTPAQLNQIRTGLLDMSKVMPTSAAELASIAENAGQLGVKAGEVLRFTEVVAQLGETTDLDFDSAAQSLARFLNITGSGAGEIRRVADVLVDLGNNSATTESQIVGFSTRLASAFTLAGATEDQILAIAASFSSMGLQAEAGGSSLSKIITSIADAARSGGDDLDTYARLAGLTTDEFKELTLSQGGAVEALLLVGQGLRGVIDDGKSITPILEDLSLNGLRTSEAFRLLALNGELVRASLDRAREQWITGGAAQAEYDKRVETTAAKLDILRNRLNTVAISLGTPLLGGLADTLDAVGDAIDRVVRLFGPTVGQLGGLFAEVARSALLMAEALGLPVLQVAAAHFLGLAVAVGAAAEGLTVILRAINSLGAIGPIAALIGLLVADIVLVGPVSVAASAALARFGLATAAVAANSTGATVGITSMTVAMGALNAVAIASPYFVLAAALIQLGRAWNSASEAGRAAGEEYDRLASRFRETGAFEDLRASVEASSSELRRLDAELGNPSGWESFKQGAAGAFEVLTTGESKVLTLVSQFDSLYESIDEDGFVRLDQAIGEVARTMGVSEESALSMADSLGVVDAIASAHFGTYSEGVLALQNYIAASQATASGVSELTGATEDLTLSFVNGEADAQTFFDAMGLGERAFDSLLYLFPEAEKQLELMFSDDKTERATGFATAIGLITGPMAEMADIAGLTTGEFRDQIDALVGLSGAYSALKSAVENANNALALVTAQEVALNEATANLQTSFEGFTAGTVSIEEAAGALRDYTLNLAATGAPIDEVKASHAALRAELIQLGVDSGLSYADAARAVDLFGGVTSAVLADLVRKGQLTRAEAELLEQQLVDMGREYEMTLLLDTTQPNASITETTAELQGMTEREYVAFLEANGAPARTESDVTGFYMTDLMSAEYLASLRANGAFARGEADQTSSYLRLKAAQQYLSTLTANGGQAISVAEQVNRAIRGIPTVWSTSIITYYRQVGSPSSATVQAPRTSAGNVIIRSADGNILLPFSSYAGGGFDLPAGTVMERPGPARIYGPATPGRFFAEPVTEGEAYIPLAPSKRDRSLAIWRETGRLIGAFANGGIQSLPRSVAAAGPTAISLVANVNVDASGTPGLDAGQVATLVESKVVGALADLGRDLADRRPVYG